MDFLAPIPSPYLVPFDGKVRLDRYAPKPPSKRSSDEQLEEQLEGWVKRLDRQQRLLYADNRYSLLLVFQAMDAAGKDSTIRAVLRGVNPAGCRVQAFEAPSREELDHDYLWRVNQALPARGMIGVFNRSHYEDVLAVRVNPDILAAQKLVPPVKPKKLWEQRFESMRNAELHWARNGMVILKFFLNVSRGEQKRRFLKRIDDPESHWKFSPGDLKDRDRWQKYMHAYQEALEATSRPWAPWYVIPADSKPFMREAVAELAVKALERLPLAYPTPSSSELKELKRIRAKLK